MKLTAAQLRFLRHLAKSGQSLVPGGYSTAGRDASNWYRTVAVLERLGLVLVTHRSGRYWTTHKTRRGGNTKTCTQYGSPCVVEMAFPAPAFVYEKGC
jgi:DNA-binding IclR family transcriptional regulator